MAVYAGRGDKDSTIIRCSRCVLESEEQADERRKRGEECPCAGGLVELPGDPKSNATGEREFWGALRLADQALRLIQSDRAPLPTEWAAQSARFVAAYDWLRPFMVLDIEESRERSRLDAQVQRRSPDAR